MNVLFIEDDRMNRRVVRDMLGVGGIVMAEADSGEQGLELIETNDYEVILLDLRMPGMDGFDVIEHVRGRTDVKAALPIVVITADTAANLRDRCLSAGADEVLFKPVAMDSLFDAIAHVLAAREGDDGMIV